MNGADHNLKVAWLMKFSGVPAFVPVMVIGVLLALLIIISLEAREPSAAPRGDIILFIEGFRNDRGKALLALYDSPEFYPEDSRKAILLRKAAIKNGRVEIILRDNLWGRYALSILHDENNNGRMDRSFLGIPREGYGLLEKTVPRKRAQRFEEQAFILTTDTLHLRHRIYYGKP